MELLVADMPWWFTFSGIFADFVFAFTALFISLAAYRVYRFTKQRSTAFFTIAFASMSLAYFVQAILHIFVLLGLRQAQMYANLGAAISSFQLSVLAVSFYIFFMIAGVSLLAYICLREKRPETFALFLLVSLVGLIFTSYLMLTFYLLTTIFLSFIAYFYYQRHLQRKTTSSLLIFLGFSLLLLGHFQLAISSLSGWFYLSGQFTALAGYISLLWSLLRVVR